MQAPCEKDLQWVGVAPIFISDTTEEVMTAKEYRKLVSEIRQRFNLPKWDAAELADLVYFGDMTKEKLFRHLSA